LELELELDLVVWGLLWVLVELMLLLVLELEMVLMLMGRRLWVVGTWMRMLWRACGLWEGKTRRGKGGVEMRVWRRRDPIHGLLLLLLLL
jgi:hypothetical protein